MVKRSFGRSERGAVLPLVALCLAVLMGVAGLVVDVGYWEYMQREQQSATDAAAIGGAQQLIDAGCDNPTVATTAADSDAARNGFTNAADVTVTVQNPPVAGPYAGNACAVYVQITHSRVPAFFTTFFGFGSNGATESTEAVAQVVSDGSGCVYLLDPNGTPTFHGTKITAPGCSLLMNGSPDFNGGTVDFSNIGYAGSSTVHGTDFTGASPAPMLKTNDPCPEIAGCASLAKNAPVASSCAPLIVTGPTINPGCYSSITGAGSFTMNPGLYILSGSNSLNGATINGTGVTLYVPATGTGIDFHGAKVNLSACASSCTGGAVTNVLYYQVPQNASPVNIAGPSGSYSGLMYAPSSNVTYDGNAGSGYSVMVFDDWTLNGTGKGMAFASPPPGQSMIKTAVLGL